MRFQVPSDSYFCDSSFNEELQHCIDKYWLFACPAVVVANPGDYYLFLFQGREYVIRRTISGGLQGFRNYCKHRGHKIYSERVGSGDVRCPYHGWLYDDANKLSKLPWNDKCYHLNIEDIELDGKFDLREKYGQVWIYLGKLPMSQANFPADQIAQSLEAFQAELGSSFAVTINRRPFNWRLIFDNLYDRVHPVFLHQKSLAKTVDLNFGPYPPDFSVGSDPDYVLANIAQTGQRLDSKVESNFLDTGTFEAGAYVNGHIYPYLHFFTPNGGGIFCFESYLPISNSETEVQVFWVASKNESKAAAATMLQTYLYGGAQVLKEDWDAVESITSVVGKPIHYTYGAHEKNALLLINATKNDD
jgi:phenylpropionate dioxygenase-like ring-hydroxylating dioxygenase large terminal subunit